MNYISTLWICIILFCNNWTTCFNKLSKECMYPKIKKKDLITGIKIDSLPIKMKSIREPFSQLRLHMHYTESFTSHPNSGIIKADILDPAIKELESVVKVKNPTNGIIRVDRNCVGDRKYHINGKVGCSEYCSNKTVCVDSTIPEKFLKKCKILLDNGEYKYTGEDGPGEPNVDLVMIVSIARCRAGSLARATACFLEEELDRPILGIIDLCQGVFIAGESTISTKVTFQHEIIHGMGFAIDKFAYYRYENGTPIVKRDETNMPSLGYNFSFNAFNWNDQIIKEVTRVRSNIHGTYNKSVFIIVLPNILKVGRKHFNCSTLDGVELEKYPGLSHFSEYLLFNEVMTPRGNGALDSMSQFTLALLQDTGWYRTDISKDDIFTYSKNLGCNLIMNGCYDYMQNQISLNKSIYPFCNKIFGPGDIFHCSTNGKFFYYCYVMKHANLSEKYQYFRHLEGVPDSEAPFYAGVSEQREFCPSIKVTSKPTSICDDTTNTYQNVFNILNSYYGKDSRCFKNGLQKSLKVPYFGASCQKYIYNKAAKTLKVFFKEKTIYCPSDKTYTFPAKDGYTATFNCPDLDTFDDGVKNNFEKVSINIWKIFCFNIVMKNFFDHY